MGVVRFTADDPTDVLVEALQIGFGPFQFVLQRTDVRREHFGASHDVQFSEIEICKRFSVVFYVLANENKSLSGGFVVVWFGLVVVCGLCVGWIDVVATGVIYAESLAKVWF